MSDFKVIPVLLLVLIFSCTPKRELSYTEKQEMGEYAGALGFMMGVEIHLNVIKSKYPDLSDKVIEAEEILYSNFASYEVIDFELKSRYSDYYNEFQRTMSEQRKSGRDKASQTLTHEKSIVYIEGLKTMVRERRLKNKQVEKILVQLASKNVSRNKNNNFKDKSAEKKEMSDPWLKLSSKEREFARNVPRLIMQNSNYLTPEIRKKYWSLLKKAGLTSDEGLKSLKDFMTLAVRYNSIFFEDAIMSINKGIPVKSRKRETIEEKLVRYSIMSKYQLDQQQKELKLITEGKPIVRGGRSVVLTKEHLHKSIDIINGSLRRFDALFSKDVESSPKSKEGTTRVRDQPADLDTQNKCNVKNPDHCLEVGLILLKKNKIAAAKKSYMLACKYNVLDGCLLTSMLFRDEDNKDQAFKFAKKGCDKNHASSCNLIGLYIQKSKGANAANQYFLKACSSGDGEGCENVGHVQKLKGNIDKATIFYQKGCDFKNGKACFALGSIVGRKGETNRAVDLYNIGCTYGFDQACKQSAIIKKLLKK